MLEQILIAKVFNFGGICTGGELTEWPNSSRSNT
jgi:hypothetical protein